MDFAHDARTTELIAVLTDFLESEVYPAEPELRAELDARPDVWSEPGVVARLRASARARGLWNLFLPAGEDGHGRGAGLSNLQYAPLAELTGRSIRLAPAALNCAAPDTGNMELLAEFGTEAQKA
jgi:acyl-CoA dehydrogenase